MRTRPLRVRALTRCAVSSGVIARHSRPKDGVDRATQYSRDVNNLTEGPQRTESSAFAEDDKLRMTAPSPLLPARAAQRDIGVAPANAGAHTP